MLNSGDDSLKNALAAALLASVKQYVLKKLVTKLPILGSSLFSGLTGYVVGKILELAWEQTDLQLSLLKIESEVSKQSKNYATAKLWLENAKTPEDQEAAKKAVIDAARKFIRF